jgi:hypothetical protein
MTQPATAAKGTRSRTPGTRRYQALINLSIPWPGENKDKNTDLVAPGDIVELTEDQARNLLTRHRVPVIRAVDEGREPLPKLTGLDVSGRIRQPAPPANDEDTGPRPDPAGSSRIQVLQEVGATVEATDPGTEHQPASALDLPPGTRVSV